MKRIFLYLVILASTFVTSCKLFNKAEELSDYEKVYNGLVMYFAVEQTNTRAMDGVNVAMRLAILLNEMESAGIAFDGDSEPDWSALGDIRYGGLNYNKKFFLFGSQKGVSISKDGDNYLVKYGTESGSHTAGTGDMCYRLGDFMINDGGNSNILQSSESKPWIISVNSDVISYSSFKNEAVPYFECSNADAKLWYEGDGEFGYSVANAELSYVLEDDNKDEEENESDDFVDYDDTVVSDWSIDGTFSIENFAALTIEDTISTDFLQSSEASGTAISGDDYEYETSSPIIYNFLSGANLKYGGVEEITLLAGNYVMVETASDGIQTVNYQGNSYSYDDEYYYFFYYEKHNEVDTEADADDEEEEDK